MSGGNLCPTQHLILYIDILYITHKLQMLPQPVNMLRDDKYDVYRAVCLSMATEVHV